MPSLLNRQSSRKAASLARLSASIEGTLSQRETILAFSGSESLMPSFVVKSILGMLKRSGFDAMTESLWVADRNLWITAIYSR